MSILGFGAFIRRHYISSKLIDNKFLIFIPIILKGPLFCFQEGQGFFTGYIFCYCFSLISITLIVKLFDSKNYILKFNEK